MTTTPDGVPLEAPEASEGAELPPPVLPSTHRLQPPSLPPAPPRVEPPTQPRRPSRAALAIGVVAALVVGAAAGVAASMPGLSHAQSQRDSARSASLQSRAELTAQRTALETTTKQRDAAKLAQRSCVSLADNVDHLSALWTRFVAAEIQYEATQPGSAAEQQVQVALTRQAADLGVAVSGAVEAADACRKSAG
jgi:hypothetical protein